MQSPIPQAVLQVIEVFATDLASVKFGDLEQGVLAQAADDTSAAAEAVAEAEAALTRAQAAFAEKQELLLQKAHRALAYARLYAEEDATLLARLESISLPKLPKRTPKVAKEVVAREVVDKEVVAKEIQEEAELVNAEEPVGRRTKRKKSAASAESQAATTNAAE